MTFQKIILNNFQRWDHLELDLASGGLILFTGKVGSGKSSIWDALTWCLFGVTLKGQKADEIVSTFAGKDCSVFLTIEDGDAVYTVQRYRGHKEHKNNLYFKLGDTDLGGWDTDSTQERINSQLGMDVKLFTNSVVFAQGFSKVFVALDDTEQKNLIEAFIDSTVYSEALKVAKQDVLEFSEKAREYERDEEELLAKIENLEVDIAQYEEGQVNFEQRHTQAIAKQKGILKGLMDDYDQKRKEQKDAQDRLPKIHKQIEKLQAEKDSNVCTACGQGLPFKQQNALDDLQNEAQDLRRTVAVCDSSLKYLKTQREETAENIVGLMEEEDIYAQLIEKAHNKKVEAELLLVETRSSKARYEDKQVLAEFFVEGFGPRGIKSLLFDDILPALNQHLEYYANIISEGTIQVKLLPNKTLKSGDIRDKFSIQISNSEGGKSYKDSSNGEKRQINLTFLFAIQRLARERLKSSINISVLDEPFDALDSDHIESIFNVLKEQAKSMSVFVVSHIDDIKSSAAFDKVYHVEKRSGRSRLNGILL